MSGTSSRIVTPAITTPDTQHAIRFLGELYRVRVSGADTAGGFAVLDTEGRRGHGSPMHVHRHDSEVFLVLSGTLRVVVDGQEHEAGEGSAAVLPAGHPHGFVVVSPTARYLTLHHGPAFEQFVAAVSEADDLPDSGRLTAIAAEHGIDIVGPQPLPGSVRLGGAQLHLLTATLLAAAVAARLGRGSPAAPDARRRALVLRIRAFIESHLCDPGLTPASIAAAHHISRRYLHKLFRAEHTTVADHVRRRRLESCRRDLLDPALADRPVSAIARRWGFGNAAHFSRAFRDAYGLPPGEYRIAHG